MLCIFCLTHIYSVLNAYTLVIKKPLFKNTTKPGKWVYFPQASLCSLPNERMIALHLQMTSVSGLVRNVPFPCKLRHSLLCGYPTRHYFMILICSNPLNFVKASHSVPRIFTVNRCLLNWTTW